MGVNFIARNRNKKSVAIDLKTDRSQQITEDLAADADILVENFGSGVLDDLGLGYERLSEVNSRLIYASIKGFDEEGPYADRKGVDLVLQAEGGLMSVTGPENGPPVKVGQALSDIGAGLYATIGILTALNQREHTGRGQKISTDLFGTIISFMEEYLTMYGITGEDPTPFGARHQTIVPSELFETEDGYIVLLVQGHLWETFCEEVLDASELAEYDTVAARQRHYDEIMDVMRPTLREKTTDEWQNLFDELGFPSGRLNQVSDVVTHPQARDRDYVFEYDGANIVIVILHDHPLHFSDAERTVRWGPPLLGEHTEAVLADHLELADEGIRTLFADEVVA